MNQFIAFIIKETRHILRDKRTMLVLFGIPIIQMLLFGFAISTDVRNVRTAVVLSTVNHKTQQMVEKLGANEYFNILYKVRTTSEAESLIRHQKADVAINFSEEGRTKSFGSEERRGKSEESNCLVQIITDGTDPSMAQMYANYATQILQDVESRKQDDSSLFTLNSSLKELFTLRSSLLYNPQMRSSYNFVPGIMGIILMLICAMMTSISVVREKERGTMDVLTVSPIRPMTIIFAKAVPYLVLAFVILTAILLIAKYVLMVPLAGSLFWIYVVSGIYILLALSLGLLISTIAETQLVALLASVMMLLMPSILLSGMIYPVESMPEILQYVSAVIPPRYYISAMRKLLVMGVGIDKVVTEVAVLIGMTAVLLTAALLKVKR